MNILVINGSPKGERSNTWQLTKAFLAGMRESGEALEIRELEAGRMNIHPCLGCFSCWNKTPGQCCITDDMGQVIEKLLWADVTIWSFPLYYFSVPGPLKNLIDYDKANKAHYCETLKMFFHHNMKMSQTADALGIHISTLKYRINRIRGLLDLDLDQFTSRLYLQLVMDLLK